MTIHIEIDTRVITIGSNRIDPTQQKPRTGLTNGEPGALTTAPASSLTCDHTHTHTHTETPTQARSISPSESSHSEQQRA